MVCPLETIFEKELSASTIAVTYQGFMYNEASIVAPVENISNGSSVILLVIAYVISGNVDSVWDVLSGYKIAGVLFIITGIVALPIVQHNEAKAKGLLENNSFKAGASALIFPVLFSLLDGTETIITGLCMDKTFGYAMPEGDGIIIMGMDYAIIAFFFWIYVSVKEKHIFTPVTKKNLPILGGALCDNVAIVFYAYAIALDSVATDPVLAVYPIISVVISRLLLKEKLSLKPSEITNIHRSEYFILEKFNHVFCAAGTNK